MKSDKQTNNDIHESSSEGTSFSSL